MIQGKIGKKKVIWKTAPKGKVGEGLVSFGSADQSKNEIHVRWNRDDQGIWIETPSGFFGYDVRKTT